MRGQPDPEVRPGAFKSMLRYWFRVFALGVLPACDVKNSEAQLFGAINPQKRGFVAVRVINGKLLQKEPSSSREGKYDPCGEQAGTLILAYSSAAPVEKQKYIKDLLTNLCWMMFHLGGIGQGARRPSYSRQTREYAPWWRGSTLVPDSEESFRELPDSPQGFQKLFRQRSQTFYNALAALTGKSINPKVPLNVGQIRNDRWTEAVDANCRIVVCTGNSKNDKPYALAVLHDPSFKQGQNYDGNLCGKVSGGVKPSPVWIADLDNYQVVTVFGATTDPRKRYLKELRDRTSAQNYVEIWSV